MEEPEALRELLPGHLVFHERPAEGRFCPAGFGLRRLGRGSEPTFQPALVPVEFPEQGGADGQPVTPRERLHLWRTA